MYFEGEVVQSRRKHQEKNDKPVRLEGGDHLVLVVHYLEDQVARYGGARVEQVRDVGGPVKVGRMANHCCQKLIHN